MKKAFCFAMTLVMCLLASCAHLSHNTNLIEEGTYYQIYQKDSFQKNYQILNAQRKVVLSDTTDRPLDIRMIDERIVDIAIGLGTGITTHQYYDVDKDAFSQHFSYVAATSDELVAYVNLAEDGRSLVVQNIFDPQVFCPLFHLDFAQTDTPVVDAQFSNDGKSIELIYLTGSAMAEKTLFCH